MTRSVRAAIVQAEVSTTLRAGLSRTAELVAEAAGKRANIVVFPETWLPGYPAWLDVCRDAAIWDHAPVKTVFARLADNSVSIPGAASDELSKIAKASRVTLVVGVSERVESGPGMGTLYNSVCTFGPDGALINHHRKLLATFSERMVWGHGDAHGLRAVSSRVGDENVRIGALICWEHWMPLARQALHESGMRASALPSELEAHPDKITSGDQWVLRGGGAIIGPDGTYLAGPVYDEPTMLVCDLDLGHAQQERLTLDVAGHYSRPDIFEFRVASTARPGSPLL